ncbi:signal peptidase I [Aestuariivirga sp.]|jgi:signal peptidase I|uniref:signal peptidase I n=1 Tax=Aestuariivirga sp. TaxID=2650926 RepID=UPI003785149D
MTNMAGTPRNTFGLIAIAPLLGAAPLMLWMGRWRLAVFYFGMTYVLFAALFVAALRGLLPIELFRGIDLLIIYYIAPLTVALAALAHALSIRRTALERPWYSRWYVALPSPAALNLVAAFGVTTFLYQPFSTPAINMWPSLVTGDYFAVSKTAYNGHDPQRGDIAVYRLNGISVTFVQRVIGLPGDRVQVIGGVLHINGAPVMIERVEASPEFMQDAAATLYRETLPGGSSHVIADTDPNGAADNTDEYVVPPDHYFVMGDNRDNAADSRYARTGFVPRANFVGRFSFLIWNEEGVPLMGRPE